MHHRAKFRRKSGRTDSTPIPAPAPMSRASAGFMGAAADAFACATLLSTPALAYSAHLQGRDGHDLPVVFVAAELCMIFAARQYNFAQELR